MTTPLPLVKGQTLKSMLLYVESQLTPPQVRELLGTLSAEERRDVSHILATSTYPVRLVNRLTIEAARLAGRPLPEFARAAGRFSAAEGLKGVYRFFARILTPEALLAKATAMWSSMNLAGTMTMEQNGSGKAVVFLRDYPGPEEVMCLRVTGWMEELLELAGSKNPLVTHARCVARGAKACEWHVTW